ncbi:hypothetical protein I553_5425 [Mycobacterium xenopi 4042]|uniref:Uncharacterized protein n=1 Tax=Mycobacterium xenopi 4042 TaxID=1299334 RepID=X7ZW91_MYCXE|nr:hypothetical protein I553_5425 [Mycobacterium xenopi 4042]
MLGGGGTGTVDWAPAGSRHHPGWRRTHDRCARVRIGAGGIYGNLFGGNTLRPFVIGVP